jgi:galactokinase
VKLVASRDFHDLFGVTPAVRTSAPGRVNLIGDHTDYNNGYVMPVAIPQETIVELARGTGDHVAYSDTLGRGVAFNTVDATLTDFAKYVGGCIKVLEERNHYVPPLRLRIFSEVPVGAGLSSSAALEVAVLRALNMFLHLGLDDMTIAHLAWEAETRHAGLACGIMDQVACSLATSNLMLFLDTKTLERALLPLPAEVLVIDSGHPRTLTASKYNERRAECEAAAAALGVSSLRDITDPTALEELPPILRRRARHVVTENKRVLEARTAAARAFGRLMNESHASLRDDYEVSVPALDAVVDALQGEREVFGARMTGAGFGGACVALVEAGSAAEVGDRITRGGTPGASRRIIVPPPS